MWQNTDYGYGAGGYGWMHDGGAWLGMGLHGLLWFLVLAGIAVAVVWAMRLATRPSFAGPDVAGQNGRDLLDARYARGEIDREEYLARKRDLKT